MYKTQIVSAPLPEIEERINMILSTPKEVRDHYENVRRVCPSDVRLTKLDNVGSEVVVAVTYRLNV